MKDSKAGPPSSGWKENTSICLCLKLASTPLSGSGSFYWKTNGFCRCLTKFNGSFGGSVASFWLFSFYNFGFNYKIEDVIGYFD